MATHKLIPYSIRLRKKNEPNEWWDLGSLQSYENDFSNDNFLDFFTRFCKEYQQAGPYTDADRSKTFGITDFHRDNNTIEGVINTGNYGFAADLYDVEDQEYDDEGRLPTHSEEYPFYFMIHQPDGGTERAFLILKRFRNFGAKTALQQRLNDSLRDVSRAILLRMPTVMDSEFIQEITGVDRIAKLKFIKESVPRSIHEQMSSELSEGEGAKETVEIRADRDSTLYQWQRFKAWLRNEEYPFMELYDGDWDDVKVTIEQEESERTFSIFDDEIRMQEVVEPPEDVLEEGHPPPEWLSTYARDFMNDILRRNGFEEIESTPLNQ